MMMGIVLMVVMLMMLMMVVMVMMVMMVLSVVVLIVMKGIVLVVVVINSITSSLLIQYAIRKYIIYYIYTSQYSCTTSYSKVVIHPSSNEGVHFLLTNY